MSARRTLRATMGNPSASLLADPGGGLLKREGAGGKGPRGRTGGAVVTERVKHSSAGTEPGCKRQRQAQAARQEYSELSGGDGDCFVSREDCKAAGGVWPSLGQQQRTGRGR